MDRPHGPRRLAHHPAQIMERRSTQAQADSRRVSEGPHMRLEDKARKFAILARVSTREQIQGHSLEVQQKLCAEYVKKSGGTVVETYEAQESATTEDRKALPKVLADAGSV